MAKTLNDSQLLQLASDPRARLFPPLRGATVFGPIVVLTGLIPCLAAVLGAELTDRESGWALRALDLTTAVEVQDWLEPGRNGLARGLIHQPPLSSWLLALLAPDLGAEQLSSWRVLSVSMSCCAIWAMYLLGRRIGGASFGLIVALALCGHPVMLRLATGTGPAALGMVLIALTVWGFLGHLEGPAQLVSTRMLAGAVAWGLALLSVGPVAVVLFIPMLVTASSLNQGQSLDSRLQSHARLEQLWLGLRTLVVFLFTALSFSGWWQLMMLANHGGDFWHSWWTGQVAWNTLPDPFHSVWRNWLSQNSFLCGWLVLGLFSILKELANPSSELVRRRCQFLLLWWLAALFTRIMFDIPGLRPSTLIDAWDAMFLLPTSLLVAWGVRSAVLRQAELGGEALLVVATLGLCVWRMSHSASAGFVAFIAASIALALLPAIAVRVRRGARRWTERDWRRLMRVAMIVILAGHLVAGIVELPQPSLESQSLTELRKRIEPVPALPRVTLMTMTTEVPESLLFLLRSRWPKSQFVVADSREGRSSRETTSVAPDEELVIEWTRHGMRITTELSVDRQATAVGEPVRFRGRRLRIYRVGPRQR